MLTVHLNAREALEAAAALLKDIQLDNEAVDSDAVHRKCDTARTLIFAALEDVH